ncbi:MAG TPA: glycosyltransferase family 9 protein [Gemmatimonadales bacterium]|nr:glycosyltransferase family 9 protein [Gemmatimonadales bacterium]
MSATIPDSWKTGRIAIVMMSAIGDTVHVLPVISALKRHAPRTHITWILQPGPASLVRGHGAVDEIVLFEKAKGWRAYAAIRDQLRAPFDLVLALQVYAKAGLVTALLRSPVKLGFDRARARDLNWLVTTHRIPPHAPQHVQDQYFEFLRHLGVDPEPVVWNLGPWPDELEAQRAFVASLDRPAVSLVIGSADRRREWPAERWALLADALWEQFDLQPVLVGSRSARELEIEAAIRAAARSPVRSTLGASLRELVGIIHASALVISLDTAPLHMAVALDRPVIALHGTTNPKRTGPYRKFRDLIVDRYGDPGEDYPAKLEYRPGRMERITVEDVIGKVEVWKERYQRRGG